MYNISTSPNCDIFGCHNLYRILIDSNNSFCYTWQGCNPYYLVHKGKIVC